MLRIHCIRLVALSVSIVGLTSCRKDAGHSSASGPGYQRQHVFAAPQIVRQNATFALEDWLRRSDRKLTLGESVEVGAEHPAYTEVHATCGHGAEAVTHRTKFTLAHQIEIFKIVPEEVLTHNLNEKPEDCHFIIQMGDDPSSKNGYEMEAQVTGDHGQVLVSGLNDSQYGRFEVNAKDLLGRKLSYSPKGGASEAQLVCNSLTYPKVNFEGQLDMSDLRVDQPHLRDENLASKILSEKPDQLCRVIISRRETKNRDEITSLFKLRINAEKLQLKKIVNGDIAQGALMQGSNHELASYQVTNLEDDVRRVRFNKEWFGTQLAINIFEDPEAVATVDGPAWTRIFVASPYGLRPLAANETIALQPHETLRFHLKYTVGGGIKCNHIRVRMKVTDEIFLYDVNSTDNVTSGIKVDTPDWLTKVQLDPAAKFADTPSREWNICHW